MNWHCKNGFLFPELKNHFMEETKNFKLVHVLNIEVNLFKALLIQYKLIFIKTENVLRREDNFWKWSIQANKPIAGYFNILFVDAKEQICFTAGKFGNLKQIYFIMRLWIVNAGQLFSCLFLERFFRNAFNEIRSHANQEILLYNFTSSHGFTEHEKLAFILVLNILWEKNDSEIIDSALDFCFWFFKIEQLINVLHIGNRLLRVTDYYDLIMLGR